MGGIPWTKGEDQLLRKCIEQYGEGKWHRVPLLAGLNRCRKSCRLRWLNYLRPNIKKGSFEEEEIDLIIRLHRLLGNRWSLVAARLPGRTGNDVKNYWNCHLSKKLNAQETEDRDHKKHHYASGRNNVRASNSAATSSSKRPMPLPSTTSLEEDIMIMCSSSTSMPMPMPTPLPCVRELGGANNPIFQTDEEDKKINPCVEVHDGTDVGDFAMDLIFEQVNENQQDQFNNNWYWDDSILDMDLWNY